MTQLMDWVSLLLDAHFTVLVMAPEATDLLIHLYKFVAGQVRVASQLGKLQGSLLELQKIHKMKQSQEIGQYSIEIIEIF